jgi:hypothetical protein
MQHERLFTDAVAADPQALRHLARRLAALRGPGAAVPVPAKKPFGRRQARASQALENPVVGCG